jgi:phenylpropionate dioxygenase-like ring-hydroxylating dioxygenase large terminal subunit
MRATTGAVMPGKFLGPRVPTSTKAPHWLLLGFRDPLSKKMVKTTVHGTDLVSFVGEDGRLRVAEDACPHRGASLARGTVRHQCVVCPYHGKAFSEGPTFFDTTVLGDNVWVDFSSRVLGVQDARPPSCPEFSDPAFRTISYTKTLKCNPILLVENTLDHLHLLHIHRVHFVDADPVVKHVNTGTKGHGLATYTWSTPTFDLTIENEFYAPFTTSLRFRFTQNGKTLPPLLLWFSVTPTRGTDEVALHLKISRAIFKEVPCLTDAIFKLVDELPLQEDAEIVGSVSAAHWSRNALTPADAHVAAYRAAMLDLFPDILAWYVQ